VTDADASTNDEPGARGRLFGVRPARLLLAAGAFHVVAACVAAAAKLPPFAPDAARFEGEAWELARRLTAEGLSSWLGAAGALVHVRLYSLSYAALGPLLGRTPLCAEPLNLILYLGTLWVVYRIGAAVFGARAGLVSAASVALWPSYLLHTTLPLKDPLSIACLLSLVLVCVTWLGRKLTPACGLATACAAVPPTLALASMKSNMWETLVLLVALGVLLLAACFVRARRVAYGNALCAALVVGFVFAAPQQETAVRVKDRLASEEAAASGGGLVWTLAGSRVAQRRAQFVILYKGSGSAIDEDVAFRDTSDIVRHLPRAAAIGLFAPFPSMWFGSGGHVGRGGRLVAGVETLLLYFVEALACFGLWRARREPAAWLIALFALASMLAMGLVVTNVGAAFRLRYPFMMLVLILCVGGVSSFAGRRAGASRGTH
jgi:hypothetical protein